MAATASSRSPDVCWSSDRNAAPKALPGVALGYCDTLINLLCRDINETASRFGHAWRINSSLVNRYVGRFQIFHNTTRNFCNLRDSTLHVFSTIEQKLGGFGKTPRVDPLILSSQEADRRANSVRLKGGRSNEKYTVKSRTEGNSDAEF
jgi:hypothetical protein